MQKESLSVSKLFAKYWLELSIGVVALATLIVGVIVSQSSRSGTQLQSAAPASGIQVSRLLSGSTLYSLDSMAYGKIDRIVNTEKVHHAILQEGQSLTIRGWAVDSPHAAPASSVVVQIDNVSRVSLGSLYGRPDVAKGLSPNYLNSGFWIVIPETVLPPGTHTLSLLVGDAAQTGYYLEPNPITVTVLGHPAVKPANRPSEHRAASTNTSLDRSVSGLPLLETKTLYSLDTVEVGGKVITVAGEPQVTLHLVPGQGVTMGGWAIDLHGMKPAGGVSVNVDGRQNYAAAYGWDRQDVATGLNTDSVRLSGFNVHVPGNALAKGRHKLSLIILNAEHSGYYEINDKVAVDVE